MSSVREGAAAPEKKKKSPLDEPTCACRGANLSKFIQPVILAILKKGPSKGYGIIHGATDYATFDKPPDATGLYRTLRQMEEKGLIEKLDTDEYQITAEGRICLKTWKWTLREYADNIRALADEIDA